MQREYILVAMLLPRFAVAVLVSAVLTACAHGVVTELPTSPGPRIKALIVTPQGGGNIILGVSVPIMASGNTFGIGALAEYSDGSAKYVDAQWTSSNADVVMIENGSLIAIGPGTARVTAKAEGLTASETFTVQLGVPGTWEGAVVVEQCTADSGSMLELICSNLPGRQPGLLPVGGRAAVTFTIEKNGTDLTARARLGELEGTLHGIYRGANFLTLSGNLIANHTTLTMMYWDSHVDADAMDGYIGFEIRIDGVPGKAILAAKLDTVLRR